MNAIVNTAFMQLAHRAELNERAKLVSTFVNVGPLFTVLSTRNHQILYGRRGTGKTHALLYLAETVSEKEIAIYIDMRTVGSTGGLYSDPGISLTQRGTRLLADTLGELHSGLLVYATENAILSELAPPLDQLADSITEVFVQGPIQVEQSQKTASSEEQNDNLNLSLALTSPSVNIGVGDKAGKAREQQTKTSSSGPVLHRVHFGAVGQSLARITSALKNRRIWIILDEWSVIPADLQPLLADLLRRSVFPVQGITVKIGAIEQRSHFQISGAKGDYIGIELGADASADLNLDDFMVFDNDEVRATTFFETLLFNHFASVVDNKEQLEGIDRPQDLTRVAFTRRETLWEFVRATEGVPRDAINIISLAARKANDNAISVEHIRTAAKTWYQRDKDQAVSANAKAKLLLHKIIDEVIGHRQARTFLFRSDAKHPLIDELFDKRVLHILKRNISAHDQPGVRYDVFKIDYGCYVDLLTTNKTPLGLLPLDDTDNPDQFVNVPPDDYRSIRRAILDLSTVDV